MNIPQVLSLIAGKPLAVTPAKLQAVTDYLQTRQNYNFDVDFSKVDLEATQERVMAAERKASGAGVQYGDEIEVIPITGSLVNRSASGSSGMTNYRNVQRWMKQAAGDPDVGGVIVDFQTSGGMVVQCQRTMRLIRQVAEIKPVIAYVDAYAYSAGFYLASGASRIILGDANCSVGSVGVIAMVLDASKAYDKAGLHYDVIKAGARKDELSPLKPLADDVRAELQASVDRTRLIFAQDVAEARGLSVDAVLDTEAGVFDGQEAIDVGFADEIASFDDTVGIMRDMMARGSQHYFNMSAGTDIDLREGDVADGKGMSTAQRIGAMMGADPEGFKAAMGTFCFQSADSVNQQFQDLREESLKKGMEKGRAEGLESGKKLAMDALKAVSLGGGTLELAMEIVAAGMDQEAAGKKVQDYRAGNSERELGDTVTTPMTEGGKHPFLTYGD